MRLSNSIIITILLFSLIGSLNAFGESNCLISVRASPQEKAYQDFTAKLFRQKRYEIDPSSSKKITVSFRSSVGVGGCDPETSLRSCSMKVEGFANPIVGNSSLCVADGHSSWVDDQVACEHAFQDANLPSCLPETPATFEPCTSCDLSFENGRDTAFIKTDRSGKNFINKAFAIRELNLLRKPGAPELPPRLCAFDVSKGEFLSAGMYFKSNHQSTILDRAIVKPAKDLSLQFKLSAATLSEVRNITLDVDKIIEPHIAYYQRLIDSSNFWFADIYTEYRFHVEMVLPLDEEANLFAIYYSIPNCQKGLDNFIPFLPSGTVSIFNVRENSAKAASSEMYPSLQSILRGNESFMSNRFVFADPDINFRSVSVPLKYDWTTNSMQNSSHHIPKVNVVTNESAEGQGEEPWWPVSRDVALKSWAGDFEFKGSNYEAVFYNFVTGVAVSVRELLRPTNDRKHALLSAFVNNDSVFALDRSKEEILGYSLSDLGSLGKNATSKFKASYKDSEIDPLDSMIGEDTLVVVSDHTLSLMKIDQQGSIFIRPLVPFSVLNRSVRGGEAAYLRTVSYQNGKLKFQLMSKRQEDINPVNWVVDVLTGKAENLGQ